MSWKRVERGIRRWTDSKGRHTYYIDVCRNKRRVQKRAGPSLDLARQIRSKLLMQLAEEAEFPERSQNQIEEIRLADFALLYRDRYLKLEAKKSWRIIMKRVNRIVDLLGSETIVCNIPRADVQNILDRLADEKGYGQHEMSRNATLNRYRVRMHNMMAFAVDRGFTHSNPVQGIRRLKERPAKTNYLMQGELDRLVEVADPRLKPMILLAAHTGLRQSEIIRLRWADVALDVLPPHLTVWADRSKNDVTKRVPLNAVARDTLKSLPRNDERVFGFARFPDKLWDKARKDANLYRRTDIERLQEFNWHSLRHHAGSWMAMKTRDIYKVAAVLGHKNLVTTQRYAHLSTESLMGAVQALEPDSECVNNVKRDVDEKAISRKPA